MKEDILKRYRDVNNIYMDIYHPLHNVVWRMCDLVECAAEKVYNLSALCSGNKKFDLWKKSAERFIFNQTTDGFIYTRYGYAVEEFFNLEAGQISFPNGYSGELQIQHGFTRPDIVIFQGNEEVAWLDITSSLSQGHIFGKIGAGWRTMPFVAELLYPSLKLENIVLHNGCGIAQRAEALHAARAASMKKRALLRHMVDCMDRALAEVDVNYISDYNFVKLFSQAFDIDFMEIWDRQIVINTILRKYKVADSARYPHKARTILNTYLYKNKSLNSALAGCVIAASYNNMKQSGIWLSEQEMESFFED